MMQFLTHVPLIHDLTQLVIWLLLMNVVLTGAVILLAFRAGQYKARAEELEAELHETIGTTVNMELPDEPVELRHGLRRG